MFVVKNHIVGTLGDLKNNLKLLENEYSNEDLEKAKLQIWCTFTSIPNQVLGLVFEDGRKQELVCVRLEETICLDPNKSFEPSPK